MKKTGKSLTAALFFMVIILSSFVIADIQSIKNEYLTTDSVLVKNTARLCSNAPLDANVSLYIVENQDVWTEGDPLVDVREEPQKIPNSQFFKIEIWEKPKAGFYDIIIDCIENEEYDLLEPADSISDVGFTVTAVTGTGKAERGSNDVGDHFWMYDSEDPDLLNEMLQLNLVAEGEDIELENITIQAQGAGDDNEIDILGIYVDENNNGKADEDETVIGDFMPAYTEDNGVVIIPLYYTLIGEKNILIVYLMKETTVEGEFGLKVSSIYGTGLSSGEMIKFSGLPITSGTKTVLPEKTCLGSLTLELDPSPAERGAKVTARVSGISGCQDKNISLRVNPCGSSIQEEVGFCVSGTEGCEIKFTALLSETYHACIDKNEDGDRIDAGEYAFEDLIVVEPEKKEKTNVTEEANVTVEGEVIEEGEEDAGEEEEVGEGETAPVTGGVISELGEKIASTNSFFILLEITLLLILFVMIMILFKMRGPAERKPEEAEKVEKADDEEE